MFSSSILREPLGTRNSFDLAYIKSYVFSQILHLHFLSCTMMRSTTKKEYIHLTINYLY